MLLIRFFYLHWLVQNSNIYRIRSIHQDWVGVAHSWKSLTEKVGMSFNVIIKASSKLFLEICVYVCVYATKNNLSSSFIIVAHPHTKMNRNVCMGSLCCLQLKNQSTYKLISRILSSDLLCKKAIYSALLSNITSLFYHLNSHATWKLENRNFLSHSVLFWLSSITLFLLYEYFFLTIWMN